MHIREKALRVIKDYSEVGMPRFFVDPMQVSSDRIVIENEDVNHISRVLRMKAGDALTVCDGAGTDYECTIASIEPDAVLLDIESRRESVSELPIRITLFQGLPKADKMELIIQKTVELGVSEIVPVAMSRSVVKLDDKKAAKRTIRWQSIAESAAKQSGRGIIPVVREPMTYGNALKYAKELDAILIPHENAEGIENTRRVVEGLKDCMSVGFFIGPEGGFSQDETEKATEAGAEMITLGRRILRTETAGLALMSILAYELERE